MELAKGQSIDVMWTMTSKEREGILLPVRIPLLKGLLGYRIFLIREGDADKFKQVLNLSQLRHFVAGQGHDWPDTQILRASNLPVHTSSNYEGLFSMLKARRFDYFPRGINEIWPELDAHKDQGMVIDKYLMLYYPSPIYFFFNPKNVALARRVEDGLKLAIEDGSFDRIFFSHPAHKKMFEQVAFEARTIITLNNPLLPAETPLENRQLWLQPGAH